MPRYLDPPSLPRTRSQGSQGVLVGAAFKRLITAPQSGRAPDGLFAADLESQLDRALDHGLAVVAAAGLEPRDIVRLAILTTVAGSSDLCARLRDKRLAPTRPAFAYREVSGFAEAGCLVEVEIEAVREA